MQQRGRKSSAQLSVIQLPGQRHAPPKALTRAQAALWRGIAATKPADWFAVDTHALLAAYCRHAATANALAEQINAVEAGGDPGEYKPLLKMRQEETAAMVKLGTALRLTPHSRLKAETAATQATNAGDAGKPWQQNA